MGTDARLMRHPLIKNLIVKKLYKYIYVFIKLITRFNHVYNFFFTLTVDSLIFSDWKGFLIRLPNSFCWKWEHQKNPYQGKNKNYKREKRKNKRVSLSYH